MLQTLQLNRVSVASFPCPALSLTIQQATESKVAAWEWGYTVTSLDTLSNKSCIHTWSTRASQQLQLIGHKKNYITCNSDLVLPPTTRYLGQSFMFT